jgi:hypothetical protein
VTIPALSGGLIITRERGERGREEERRRERGEEREERRRESKGGYERSKKRGAVSPIYTLHVYKGKIEKEKEENIKRTHFQSR